jgi:hypothetical protein
VSGGQNSARYTSRYHKNVIYEQLVSNRAITTATQGPDRDHGHAECSSRPGQGSVELHLADSYQY